MAARDLATILAQDDLVLALGPTIAVQRLLAAAAATCIRSLLGRAGHDRARRARTIDITSYTASARP